jgi:agmatinase
MVYAPPYLNFLGYEAPVAPEQARVRVLPIPYDLTTSYQPGTRRGPVAALEASTHMEWYDEELETETGAAVAIATLPPVETETSGPAAMMARIAAAAREWVDRERLLVGLGGEHSVTAPLVAAHRELWPDLTVLQVDAHADLRDVFEGSPHNHACVMRRVLESGVRIVQVGVRSLTREEHELIRADDRLTTVFARSIAGRPAREWADEVVAALGEHVYLTVDVDGFDPSIMPGTGTPEPGGLSWRQVVDLLAAVAAHRTLVGADVVELAPLPGQVGGDFLVARLAYRIMGLAARQRGWL